jgi:hypothetical protein
VTQQLGQWCHLHRQISGGYVWMACACVLTTDMIPRVFLLHVSLLQDLGHTIHAIYRRTESAEIPSFLLPSKLSGRMLLLIRWHRRMFNTCRRPKTASRPSEQAEKLVCAFKLLPSSSSMLTITPANALGPTWFDGINGSGPDLLHTNDRPHATDPRAMPPTTSRRRRCFLVPFSFQFQASGMALSCRRPLSFHPLGPDFHTPSRTSLTLSCVT